MTLFEKVNTYVMHVSWPLKGYLRQQHQAAHTLQLLKMYSLQQLIKMRQDSIAAKMQEAEKEVASKTDHVNFILRSTQSCPNVAINNELLRRGRVIARDEHDVTMTVDELRHSIVNAVERAHHDMARGRKFADTFTRNTEYNIEWHAKDNFSNAISEIKTAMREAQVLEAFAQRRQEQEHMDMRTLHEQLHHLSSPHHDTRNFTHEQLHSLALLSNLKLQK